jgi:hypothetical protein
MFHVSPHPPTSERPLATCLAHVCLTYALHFLSSTSAALYFPLSFVSLFMSFTLVLVLLSVQLPWILIILTVKSSNLVHHMDSGLPLITPWLGLIWTRLSSQAV